MLKSTLRFALILAITACASAGTPMAEAVADYGTPTKTVLQATLRLTGIPNVADAIEQIFQVELTTSNAVLAVGTKSNTVSLASLRQLPMDRVVAVEYYAASQTRLGRPLYVVLTPP